MVYLHELAQRLLPTVRRAARERGKSSRLMCVLAKRCERSAPGWLNASDIRATEFLVDVLARAPRAIPDIIRHEVPDFYPVFLRYLRQAVVEAAQPSYKPRTWFDKVWWYAWAGIAANEYAAQLRDRHQDVARELAATQSWKRVTQLLEREAKSAEPATSAAGAGHRIRFSKEHVKELGEQLWSKAGDVLVTGATRMGLPDTGIGDVWGDALTKMLRRSDDDWEKVSDFLGSSGTNRTLFALWLEKEMLRAPDLVRRLADVSGVAVPFEFAFDAELSEIRTSRKSRLKKTEPVEPARSVFRAAADLNLFGVALSGGGIRSATFNLGVLQGLASRGLLKHVDYLSTVSGGGYVGAWLASWIKRTGKDDGGRGVLAIEERLNTEPIGNPNKENVRSVRFLREYSNYLTPRPGILSADTWTMIAIWLRNTMLNQAVLVLVLAGMLMAPWTIWFTLVSLVTHPEHEATTGLLGIAPLLTGGVVGLTVVASLFTGQQLRRFNLPPEERANDASQRLGQGGVLISIVAPVTIAAFLLAIVVCSALEDFARPSFSLRAVLELAGVFGGNLLIVAVIARYWRGFLSDRVTSEHTFMSGLWAYLWSIVIILLAVGLASLTGAGLIVGAACLVSRVREIQEPPISLFLVAFAVPSLIAALSVTVVLMLGILGRNLCDEYREWWSRLGAWLNIVTLAWLVLFGLSLFSPYLAQFAQTALNKFILASGGIGWAAWTVAGVLLGKSGQTPGVGAAFKHRRLREIILSLAPYVFIAGLLVIISTAAFWLVVGMLPTASATDALRQQHWTTFGHRETWIVAGPLGLVALAFLLSCRVDINEFSMHHFYKNRLVRAYLGAARDERTNPVPRSPDPFTGFDALDDLSLTDLQVFCSKRGSKFRNAKRRTNPQDLTPYVGPMPIVNTALNLVKGDDLAWQERKAQSFVFTPFYAGYEFESRRDTSDARFAPYGFRPTLLYGYPPFGISTGTAIAISGAAASPNMGYHSSPAASFLMTMFNARLGWWMGNPRDKYNWLRSSPRRGLLYLLNELFGLTNDRTHFVNLSDGGHFENLGIYELVRRRCRYIIACDAEQDSALTFNGLGNAIRKCRMDLGVEITLRATRIQPPAGAIHSTLHCVVGDILYANGETGTLLYLKASITGDEPDDVLEYKSRQPTFPHHSTLTDQFFDESQFESYRKLGFHITERAFNVPDSSNATFEERFGYLRDYWYPPSEAIDRSAHSSQYDALLDRIRMAQSLAFIDTAFFDPAAIDRVERQELFVGASMLDLMQRVFVDLDLENDRSHPHNVGWMQIFSKWMRQEAVQKAWEASRGNYGRRFQRFVDQLPRT